jgi:hypothetical protein
MDLKNSKRKYVTKKFRKKNLRAWLNSATSYDTGFYKLSQSGELRWDNGDLKQKPSFYLDINLELADCSRRINLNFDCLHKKDVDARLKKVNVLRKVLDEIESTLLASKDESIFK